MSKLVDDDDSWCLDYRLDISTLPKSKSNFKSSTNTIYEGM